MAGFPDPSSPRFPIVLSWRDRLALGMPRYHRHFVAGRPVFLTLVCHARKPWLGEVGARAIALEALDDERRLHPFRHHDHVLLDDRSEAQTSELQSLMRTSYAVFCLKNYIK